MNKNKRIGVMTSLALVLALSGCAATEATLPGGPAPQTLASLTGHGAFRTADGGRTSCAGLSVALSADTPNTRARMQALYASSDYAMAPITVVKRRAAEAPPETNNPLVAQGRCDASGDFALGGLPAGSYFLIARVKITPPRNGADSFVVMRRLALAAGEARDITLAP